MSCNRTLVSITPAGIGVLLLVGYACDIANAGDGNVDDKVAVTGVVTFDGPKPKRQLIPMREKGGKPSECSKLHDGPLLAEALLVGDGGELANVFVYVKRGLEESSYPLPEEPAVLDQKNCMFRPRVQGIRVGQEFLMRNSDGLLHNVRSFAFRNRAFNVAQPAGTPDRKRVFDTSEGAIQIKCDIHSWMTAFIFVMDHPYFAVTDAKGQFKIAGLPPGEYTLAAWHEKFGEQRSKISVSSSGTTEVGFSFKPKAR